MRLDCLSQLFLFAVVIKENLENNYALTDKIDRLCIRTCLLNAGWQDLFLPMDKQTNL